MLRCMENMIKKPFFAKNSPASSVPPAESSASGDTVALLGCIIPTWSSCGKSLLKGKAIDCIQKILNCRNFDD